MPEGDEGAQSGADAGQSAGGPSTGESAQGGAGDGQNQQGQGQQNTAATVRAEAHERTRTRMQAADQRASKLELELKALRDKDLPEAEKLKREHGELTEKVKQLDDQLRQARIDNAFLKDNTHSWHDPGAALRMADLSRVEIDADGNVSGLKESLIQLAKQNAWMLKPSSEGADDSGDGTNTGQAATGTPPMNGKPGTQRSDRGAQARRFPVLNTRHRPS